MKTSKILGLFAGLGLLFFAACDPIEDRAILSNSFTPENITLNITQSVTDGKKGNIVSAEMATPGVIGYWETPLGRTYSNRVDSVILPSLGEQPFKFHVTNVYMPDGTTNSIEFVTKIALVNVEVYTEIPPFWLKLLGSTMSQSWEYIDVPGSGNPFFAMCDMYDATQTWWNAGNDGVGYVAGAKITLSLSASGSKYEYYANATAAPIVGTFTVNPTQDHITFNVEPNTAFLGYDVMMSADRQGNGWKLSEGFRIASLSETKLHLHQAALSGYQGWSWILKPVK